LPFLDPQRPPVEARGRADEVEAALQSDATLGFRFSVVLADSMYGESWDFTHALHRLQLLYVVAIRSNHVVWLPPGEHKRYNRWHTFDRVFAEGSSTPRFIREVVFGRRKGYRQRLFQLTTDPVRQPPRRRGTS
jgi:SRSO17 transposase